MGQLSHRRERIEADFQRLHDLEAGLQLVEQSGRLLVRGTVTMVQPESGHKDKINLEITFPDDYPKHEPSIHETAGRFRADGKRHINGADGSFCLWIPEESKWKRSDPEAIVTWFNEVVVFIDRQLTYEVVGTWTGPQRRHGDEGRADYLMEVTACDEFTARQALKLSREGLGSIGRRANCPCGSGKTWDKCHRRPTVLAMMRISST